MTDYEQMKKMMNHGLIIFADPPRAIVKKIKTPLSPTDVLHNEVGPDCSILSFTGWPEAFCFCERFLEGGVEEANLQECTVQLSYNPTGLAHKLKTLDNVRAASYEEAVELATQQARDFFDEQEITEKVGDDFEVKCYPIL